MNKKTVQELRDDLASMSLSTRGTKDQLKKRLRSGIKREKDVAEGKGRRAEVEEREPEWQPFDFYLVFDVEATCQEDNRNFHNEIIEFPIILIDGRSRTIISEFHSYVRPTLHPILSSYCTNLTGITQETVSTSPLFPNVLESFEDWLSEYSDYPFRNCVFITDGPWDIRDFIPKQLDASKIAKPPYFAKRFINLRRMYENFYSRNPAMSPAPTLTRKSINLVGMLTGLDMTFQGREHSGIDDARNIARIALKMMEDGAVFGFGGPSTSTHLAPEERG
ncbi:ribonuclease H-like domain-containing protein [Chytridium lagenaria]|nr:ribonuclease H-like domain-containing protein [Chytridium lagenaria]